MDHQQALLSKVIHDQSISLVVNARITTEFFPDDKWRRVYEFLIDHWRRFGTPPDLAVVQVAFPSYQWPVFGQSLDYFIDNLRQRRKRVILTDTLNAAAQYFQADNEPNAVNLMEQTLYEGLVKVRMETTATYDVDYMRDEGIGPTLDERELDPGYLRGISTGIRGIDYVTGGLQPEQFIVIIGLPKSMKSSTLLYMAKAVHAQARKPLFIGFEMSNQEQIDRLTSMYSGVALTKILNGTYNVRERKHIDKTRRSMRESMPFILSSDSDMAMTVSGIQAKIVEYLPDVVFIDGAYLMQSELPKVEPGSAQALANIARELKKLAQAQRISIVITTQASETKTVRGRLTAASAMYTQAWRQSADVFIGTERLYPDAPDDGEIIVVFGVLASRSGPRAKTVLSWDWGRGLCTEMDSSYFQSNGEED